VVALAACVFGLFTVRSVQIVGTNLPTALMVQAAAVSGQNIFSVRSDQVIQRLGSVPSIDVTSVTTDFPDRVVIHATARRPVVIWRSPHGALLVDRYGHVIGPAGSAMLPSIASPQLPGSDGIAAALYATRLLPPEPDGTVAGLVADPRLGLTIRGVSGWRAVLGSGAAQVLVTRVATLQSLLAAIAQHNQRLAYADLRFRGGYYRVRGP
jgi:cell division septal protein FtsQ